MQMHLLLDIHLALDSDWSLPCMYDGQTEIDMPVTHHLSLAPRKQMCANIRQHTWRSTCVRTGSCYLGPVWIGLGIGIVLTSVSVAHFRSTELGSCNSNCYRHRWKNVWMNPQVRDVYHHSDIIFQRHSITQLLQEPDAPTLRRRAAEYLPSNTTIFSNHDSRVSWWIILTGGVGAGGSSK
jgi:hypothetical protein